MPPEGVVPSELEGHDGVSHFRIAIWLVVNGSGGDLSRTPGPKPRATDSWNSPDPLT